MISLFCEDLKKVRSFPCCPGCHRADENGHMDFFISNFNIEGESVFVHGCCSAGVCSIKAEDLGPAIENRKKTIREAEK